jgi:hypothetical protein
MTPEESDDSRLHKAVMPAYSTDDSLKNGDKSADGSTEYTISG